MIKNIGVFFGAGAEISYGLPSGGKFAIDLFRQDPLEAKQKFRKILESIDLSKNYAADWLPKNFGKKNIHAFGKSDYINLITSSIEYRRSLIISYLDSFDANFENILKRLDIKIDIENQLYSEHEIDIDECNYEQLLTLNSAFTAKPKLFSSRYFSVSLKLLQKTQNKRLQKQIVAIIQLLIGAYAEDIKQDLNQNIFQNSPDDLPITDDLSGLFNIDYTKGGLCALELLFDEKPNLDNSNTNSVDLFNYLLFFVIEDLFSQILDYQDLIDRHFKHLFTPKAEWAKFTKMAIFLDIVRTYIKKQVDSIFEDGEIMNKQGYYDDLFNIIQNPAFNLNAIGTSNYNNLFQKIAKIKGINPIIGHYSALNGTVNDFYDPYKNKIEQYDEYPLNTNRILVPYLFTQSGIKPMTSVMMSKRYVSLYSAFSECDKIYIIGFGFNKDDQHINGIFRDLIEDENKKITIISVDSDTSVANQKKDKCRQLRISRNRDNLEVIIVDPNSRKIKDSNLFWYENEVISDSFSKEIK